MSLRQEVFQLFTQRTMSVLIASTAVVASTAVAVGGWKATHRAEPAAVENATSPPTLTVLGTAVRHLAPKSVSWSITLHGHDDDKSTAIEAARAQGETAHAWLTAHGIKDSELTFAAPTAALDESTVARHHDDGTEYVADVSTGFDSSLIITIESADLQRIIDASRLAGIAEDLAGAEIESPTCSAPDASNLEQPLLSEARHQARARAESTVADLGGGTLGKLESGDVGTFEVGTDCADLTVTATTRDTYRLE